MKNKKDKVRISSIKKWMIGRQFVRGNNPRPVERQVKFQTKFDPTIKNADVRNVAKLIDYLVASGITLIFLFFTQGAVLIVPTLFFGFFYMLVFNAVLESLMGKSIGKIFMKIQVINDFGKKPNIFISLLRNLISPFTLFLPSDLDIRKRYYTQNLHNKLFKTYVISDEDKQMVLDKINQVDLIDEIGINNEESPFFENPSKETNHQSTSDSDNVQ